MSASTLAASATSVACTSVTPSSLAALRTRASDRSDMTTVSPAATKAAAMALPIPEPAPVTTTVRCGGRRSGTRHLLLGSSEGTQDRGYVQIDLFRAGDPCPTVSHVVLQ